MLFPRGFGLWVYLLWCDVRRSVWKMTLKITTQVRLAFFHCARARCQSFGGSVFVCDCINNAVLFVFLSVFCLYVFLCFYLSACVIFMPSVWSEHMNVSRLNAHISLVAALIGPVKSRLMPPHSDYLCHPKSFKALAGDKVKCTKTHTTTPRTKRNNEHMYNMYRG